MARATMHSLPQTSPVMCTEPFTMLHCVPRHNAEVVAMRAAHAPTYYRVARVPFRSKDWEATVPNRQAEIHCAQHAAIMAHATMRSRQAILRSVARVQRFTMPRRVSPHSVRAAVMRDRHAPMYVKRPTVRSQRKGWEATAHKLPVAIRYVRRAAKLVRATMHLPLALQRYAAAALPFTMPLCVQARRVVGVATHALHVPTYCRVEVAQTPTKATEATAHKPPVPIASARRAVRMVHAIRRSPPAMWHSVGAEERSTMPRHAPLHNVAAAAMRAQRVPTSWLAAIVPTRSKDSERTVHRQPVPTLCAQHAVSMAIAIMH